MRKNSVQAKQWLENKTQFDDFKGRRDTDDANRSGYPNEVVTPDNIKKLHKILLNDRKVKLRELADIVKISKARVSFILHEHCSKWVLRLLTFDQKQESVNDSVQCLAMLKRNKPKVVRNLSICDNG